MKKYLIYGACALMTMGLASCHAEDPLYDNVVPAPVQKLPTGVSGVVTDASGNPVAGVTVTLANGVTTTTDSNGHYSFNNVAAGEYKIVVDGTASLQGASRKLTVSDVDFNATQEYVENFTLYTRNSAKFSVTMLNGGSDEVTSDAIPGNSKGQVDIVVDVPDGAVSEDVDVWITPIYTEESDEITKTMTGDELLIGATLRSSKPVTLSKDINVTFDVDNSVANVVTVKKYSNGAWVDVPASQYSKDANGVITVPTRDFTSFGLFLNMNVTTAPTTIPVALSPAGYNNVDGTSNYYFEASKYDYMSGTSITMNAANKLQGLMIEYIARTFGMKTVQLQGTYPVNKNIPVGTFYNLSGYQERTKITVTKDNTSVEATTYGTVFITATSGTGAHNGGGN